MSRNNIVLIFIGLAIFCFALVALKVTADVKGIDVLGAGLCSLAVAFFIDHLPAA